MGVFFFVCFFFLIFFFEFIKTFCLIKKNVWPFLLVLGGTLTGFSSLREDIDTIDSLKDIGILNLLLR